MPLEYHAWQSQAEGQKATPHHWSFKLAEFLTGSPSMRLTYPSSPYRRRRPVTDLQQCDQAGSPQHCTACNPTPHKISPSRSRVWQEQPSSPRHKCQFDRSSDKVEPSFSETDGRKPGSVLKLAAFLETKHCVPSFNCSCHCHITRPASLWT